MHAKKGCPHLRTNDLDGTENTTSALLDESETSEKEVLPTIIILIMFANTISALADILILSADSLIVFSNAIKLLTNTIKRDKKKLLPPEINIVFHRVFHSPKMDILIVSQGF